MSFIEPIVPEPQWGRPSPGIPDEEIYDDDDEDQIKLRYPS